MKMIRADIADGFPVILMCLEDGRLMFSPMGQFPVIVEEIPQGISSVFHVAGFELKQGGELGSYHYDLPYEYKQMPTLKAWLLQQKLICPVTGRTYHGQGETHETQN